MKIFENNFDQANGVAVTTANSAGSGSAFGGISLNATTLTYSTEQHAHGSASMKVTAAGAGTGTANVTKLALTDFAVRFYLRLTGLPNAPMNLLYAYVDASTTFSLVNLNTDGHLSFQSPLAGSTSSANYSIPASTLTLALNHWYRIEAAVHLSSSTGSVLVEVFDGDSTTALATSNPTGIYTADAGTSVSLIQLGKGTTAPVIAPYYLDGFVLTNDLTLPGPFTAPKPSVVASAAVTGTTVALSGTVATYDNVAPSYAWTQTAGPSLLTGTSSTAAPSYTLSQAGSYSFRLTVTDDLGQTAYDDVSFSYAGTASSPGVTGTPYSSRFVEEITAVPVSGGAISWTVDPAGPRLIPAGVTCVVHGPTPPIATVYTVVATEAGNANTTSFRFTVAGAPTTTGGGIRILQATGDQAAGGSFA